MKTTNNETACLSLYTGNNETKISSKRVPSLEGDYILIRFSSLLPQYTCKNGKVTSCNSQPCSLPGLIPGGTAVILPIIIPVRGWDSPAKPLLDMIGLEEVECLKPSYGGPSAGQCQFACLSAALSDSFISLGNNSRLDLELRRLAIRVIETNPTMYQDFLTAVSQLENSHCARFRYFLHFLFLCFFFSHTLVLLALGQGW